MGTIELRSFNRRAGARAMAAALLLAALGGCSVDGLVGDASLPSGVNDPVATELFDMPLDELLIVAPPEQPTDPARRLHRPGKLIHLSVGPYEVSGSAHVPAGAEAIAFLLRHNTRFVALRRATIDSGDAPEWDVVLVNLSQAHSTRNADAAGPPPPSRQ